MSTTCHPFHRSGCQVAGSKGTCFEDLLILKGHIGVEIFNTSCWLEINKGHSLVHWDGLLRRGQNVWGLATDDSHFFYPDYGRG
jgi:hypothetical protein